MNIVLVVFDTLRKDCVGCYGESPGWAWLKKYGPVQTPHPPIVGGGMSPPAVRRAARYGKGWYGFGLDLETTACCVAGLREAQQSVERPAELGPLEISVTPSGPLDADAVSRFEDLGVDRLVLLALGGSADDLIAFVEKMANAFL